jgi:TRAP-type C4-dicarboxylate transport system permease small subunit
MGWSSWDAAMNFLERWLRLVSYALGSLALIILTVQVFTRYVFSYVPVWGNELSRYLMVWMTLLLIPVLIRSDDHLSVDFVIQKFNRRTQIWLRSLQLVGIALFGLVFAFWGFKWSVQTGLIATSSGLDIQMIWIYIVIPISGILITIFSIDRAIQIHVSPDATVFDREGFENA